MIRILILVAQNIRNWIDGRLSSSLSMAFVIRLPASGEMLVNDRESLGHIRILVTLGYLNQVFAALNEGLFVQVDVSKSGLFKERLHELAKIVVEYHRVDVVVGDSPHLDDSTRHHRYRRC